MFINLTIQNYPNPNFEKTHDYHNLELYKNNETRGEIG